MQSIDGTDVTKQPSNQGLRFMLYGRVNAAEMKRRVYHSGKYTRYYSSPTISEIGLRDPRERYKIRTRSLSPPGGARKRRTADLLYGDTFPRPMRYVFDATRKATSLKRTQSVESSSNREKSQSPTSMMTWDSGTYASLVGEERSSSPVLPFYYFPALDGLKAYFSTPQLMNGFELVEESTSYLSDPGLDRLGARRDQLRPRWTHYSINCRVVGTRARNEIPAWTGMEIGPWNGDKVTILSVHPSSEKYVTVGRAE